MELKKIDNYRWMIPRHDGMRVPGIIYTSEKMLQYIKRDDSLDQVKNVAFLPGILKYSIAMPDIHRGYGFSIGGVAAFDIDGGVISPGGIGYDINCGVRVLRTKLKKKDIEGKIDTLIAGLYQNIPSGVGSKGKIRISNQQVKNVLEEGSLWAINHGYGEKRDADHTEENGCMEGADADKVSYRALERGAPQLCTLGAGNHFMEIQEVEEVYDEKAAQVFGLSKGQITVMIHCGSRGLGHQVCDDYIKVMDGASRKYKIALRDRQLVCAPIGTPEADDYFCAMKAAANFAWANRQCIMHWTRETFEKILGMSPKELGMELIYDVSHNIGKIEEHIVDGKKMTVCIHRKGATRSFPPSRPEVPEDYREVGQPVLIPGTMGTNSYILVGTEKALEDTWGSTCHGAGRIMSRHQALKTERAENLIRELGGKGIKIQSKSYKTLAEESPRAYKNVDEVVDTCHGADISRKVAKLRPLGVVKG